MNETPRPSMTRPSLPVLHKREGHDQLLYNADPACNHYVVVLWSGVRCVRCDGWYCS